MRGWIEALTSLGRLILFDQPGTGASDPIAPDAMPTLEQWSDSITVVLDDLGSREAVLIAVAGAFAPAALFAAAHPSRTTALVVLEGFADPIAATADGWAREETRDAFVGMWGTGEYEHLVNPDIIPRSAVELSASLDIPARCHLHKRSAGWHAPRRPNITNTGHVRSACSTTSSSTTRGCTGIAR